MALITLPTWFKPRACSLVQSTNQRVNASPFGGSEQAIDLLNDRWLMTCELTASKRDAAAAIEAFINSMRGQTNTVALYHFARQNVRGTIAGAKTLSASAAQGASSISITATTGTTLLAGDMIGVGGLLLMVAADATASAGVMSVSITNRLRVALSSGAAVTTSKPTSTFRMLGNSGVSYVPGYANTVSFDFGEAI